MRKIPHIGKCKYCNSNVWYVPIFDISGKYFTRWSVVNSNNVNHTCVNNPYNNYTTANYEISDSKVKRLF